MLGVTRGMAPYVGCDSRNGYICWVLLKERLHRLDVTQGTATLVGCDSTNGYIGWV